MHTFLFSELTFATSSIPLLYSLGMGSAAVAALVFGNLLDRAGFWTAVLGILLGLSFAPLVFLGGKSLVIAGMIAWGLGLGLQESALRAVLGLMVAPDRRASAYGAFDTAFGIFWFVGSAIMGVLYDHSITDLVWFSVVCQALAAILLLHFRRLRTG